MAEIYRKSSLDRLSSPEQLDRLIRVTSPAAWLSYLGAMLIIAAAIVWSIFGRLPQKVDVAGIYLNSNKTVSLTSPTSGIIKDVNFSDGDMVKLGDTIISIADSDGFEENVRAVCNGKITNINYSVGDFVVPSDEIAKLMPVNDEKQMSQNGMEMLCYVPVSIGKNLQPDMDVTVVPSNISEQEYGHMIGSVERISENILNTNEMMMKLGNEILVTTFQQQGPLLEVVIKMQEDGNTQSGYKWSNKNGDRVVLTPGTMISAKVIMKSEAPIVKLLPFLKA